MFGKNGLFRGLLKGRKSVKQTSGPPNRVRKSSTPDDANRPGTPADRDTAKDQNTSTTRTTRRQSTPADRTRERNEAENYDPGKYDATDPAWIERKQKNKARLDNDTKNFNARSVRAAWTSNPLQLTRKGMTHILSRHHLAYFGFLFKPVNTFFPKGMSIAAVVAVIAVVARTTTMLRRTGRTTYQFEGTVNGTRYRVGVNRGRVSQLYPLPKSAKDVVKPPPPKK